VTVGATTHGGSINLQGSGGNLSTGTVTFGASCSVAGITTVAGAGHTISLVNTAGGDVVVTSTGCVNTSGNTIALISAANVKLGGNVSTGSASNCSAVDLVAQAGSITRTNGTATVTSGTVVADATAGIGASSSRVALSTTHLQLGGAKVGSSAVANGGCDFVLNSGAPLTLAGTNAGAIDVLQSGAGTLTIGLVTVTGANLAAPPLPSKLCVTQATSLTATGGKTITLSTDTAAIDVKIPVIAGSGDIGIVSATGVTLESCVSTGANCNAHVIDVVARGGSITRTAGTLTSGLIGLDATAGIGAAGLPNRVAVSATSVQLGCLSVNGTAVANAGNDFIAASGRAVTVAGTSTTGNLDIVSTGQCLSVGHFAANAFQFPQAPATALITSIGHTGLTPAAAGKTVSLVTECAGSIAVGDVITTNAGDVGIISIGGISLAASVTAGAANQAVLVARGGAITQSAGTVVAGTVVADSSIGIGTATNRLNTQASKIQLGDLSVKDEAASCAVTLVNTGNDFIANKCSAVVVAAKSTGGNVDITQTNNATGSQLTVGQLQVGCFDPANPTSAVVVSKPACAVTGVTTVTAGKSVSLVTLCKGDIEVDNTVSTNEGSIGLVSASGILLKGDIRTELVGAATAPASNTSLVDLVAKGTTGIGIAHCSGTVSSGFVAVVSANGIGAAAAGKRLAIDATNLQLGGIKVSLNGATATAVSNNGCDFVANAGTAALTVSGTSATGNIDLTQNGKDLTIGSPTIGTFDPANPGTSAAKVTACGRG